MKDCYANWPLFLEYIKVGLSWPPVALVLGCTVMWRFSDEIAKLINRLRKVPGVEFDGATTTAQAQTATPPDPADAIGTAAADPARAREAITLLRDMVLCEQAYNLIFGTQMNLLHFLRIQGAQGSDLDAVDPFFQKHLSLIGEQTAPTLDLYLAFLRQRGLLEDIPGQRLRITPFGARFLDHIVGVYTPPPFRPF